MAVHLGGVVVVFIAQLHIGNLFQPKHVATRQGLDYQFAKLIGTGQASAVLHCVFVGRGVIGTEGAGGGFDVLPREYGGYVVGYEPVLRHTVGLQPEAHAVIGAEQLRLSHAADALQSRFDIDFHVVVQKRLVEAVIGRVEGKGQQLGILLLFGGDTGLGGFCRKLAQCGVHTVLHVHGCHVGIGSLLEVDVDGGVSRVRCRGGHIGHVFHAVDGFFQRHYHGFLHGFGVGSGIGCPYIDGGRGDVGILLHRQGEHGDDAQQHNHHRDNAREHRAVYKKS